METYDKVLSGGIVGFILGVLLGGSFIWGTASLDNARMVTYENTRKVIRTHEEMRADQVYIQELTNTDSYISIKKYLESVQNEQDRTIEKAKIEKLVGTW